MAAETIDVRGGAGVVPSRPSWGRSLVAGWCALVAGPIVGLAVVFTTIEIAAAIAGWPANSADFGGMIEILPRVAGVWGALDPVVFGVAWYADARVRRWVFRRLAGADVSMTAALISTVLAPGLWLVDASIGIHGNGAWLWSIVVGPVFLRWHARRSEDARRPRVRRPVAALLCGLIAAGAVSAVALAGQSHLAASFEGVGLNPSSGGYDIHDASALPLKTLAGRNQLPQTAYFDFELGNNSPLTLTITGATAAHTGPAISSARTEFLPSDGTSGGHSVASITVARGDPVTVRVVLGLRACPAGSRGEVSTVSAIKIRSTALQLSRTVTVTPRYPLRLTCP